MLLGRPGNNLKIGIVGLPNVGKSSFFNVLSSTGPCVVLLPSNTRPISFFSDLGKAANFPYATINPEEARIPVPDPRFDWLCDLYKPVSRVPAFLTCIDIAGLTAVGRPLVVVHRMLSPSPRRARPRALGLEMPSCLTFAPSMASFRSSVHSMTRRSPTSRAK